MMAGEQDDKEVHPTGQWDNGIVDEAYDDQTRTTEAEHPPPHASSG